jgi:hypothetical protein
VTGFDESVTLDYKKGLGWAAKKIEKIYSKIHSFSNHSEL